MADIKSVEARSTNINHDKRTNIRYNIKQNINKTSNMTPIVQHDITIEV